jgi:YVTN family beta-propeller protein
MGSRLSNFVAAVALVSSFAATMPVAHADDPYARAYVVNRMSASTSVIDTGTDSIIATFPVGGSTAVASPDGSTVYVAGQGNIAVVSTATNAVTTNVALNALFSGRGDPINPVDIAITPDGNRLYVAGRAGTAWVSVVDTRTNSVVTNIAFSNDVLSGLAVTPDGKTVYVMDESASTVSTIDTASNAITSTFSVGHSPHCIAISPDGRRAYIGLYASNYVVVLDIATKAVIADIPVNGPSNGIAITPDGNTIYDAIGNGIAVVTTATNTVTITLPDAGSAQAVAVTPEGTAAFVVNGDDTVSVISIKTNTIIARIPGFSFPQGFSIAMGPARNLILNAAVLPSSRSVQVGSSATLFGTIINSGPGTASNCRVAPATSAPATFTYQTTDPATNGLTGTANTPMNIPQGGAQSFLLAFTPSAAFGPTDVAFSFFCSNAVAAASYSGVNTLLLSASATPVPDVVAIALTATNDGILHVPGSNGSGALAVAIANVGSGDALTVQADTGGASLPLMLTLCQTNPATAACLATPSSMVPTTVNGNGTATYSVFAKATGTVPFMPAANRIFIRFVDSGGVTRGSTSVAVQTQ